MIEIRTAILVKDLPADVQTAMTLDRAVGLLDWKPFPTNAGPAVNVARVYACERCRRDAERAAARGPSYALTFIDRGPGADKVTVQVS